MKRLLVLFLALLIGTATWSQTKNFIDQPYIEVNGSADSLVTPDEIYIDILLSEKDTRDRVSLEELETRMFAELKSLGIDMEKDLAVGDILSNFRKYLLKTKDILKSKVYILKAGNAELASKVFSKLEASGISNVTIDRVAHSKMAELQLLVKSKAILNAKARAIALTKPLDQQLGSAIHITDTENVGQFLQGRIAGIQIRGSSSVNSYNKETPKIEFEKIRISMVVNAVFILK